MNGSAKFRSTLGLVVSLVGVGLLPPMARAQTEVTKAPPSDANGIVNATGDRPSQADAPPAAIDPNDPQITRAVAASASATGPSVTRGPGEVDATPAEAPPAGFKPAMDLVATEAPVAPVAGAAKAPDQAGEVKRPILLPPPPDESLIPEATKKKRKKFDKQKSKRESRTAESETFANEDGSKTLIIGAGGAALDEKGNVSDDDKTVKPKAGGGWKRNSGVVTAEFADAIDENVPVVAVGTPGKRVGFKVNRRGSSSSVARSASCVTPPTAQTVPVGNSASSTTTALSTTTTTTTLSAGNVATSTSPTSSVVSAATTTTGVSPSTTTTTSTAKPACGDLPKKGSSSKGSGDRVSYPEAYGPGTELRYTTGGSGVKEEIVLSAPPIDDPVYRFPMDLDGLTPKVNANGSVSFLDAKGVPQWVIPGAGVGRTGGGAASDEVLRRCAVR